MDKKIPHKEKIVRFVQIAQSNWERATINQSAAEMAYFVLLSLLPLLLVVANIIPLLPMETTEVLGLVQSAMPADIYSVIEPTLESYLETASGGAISFGLLAAIFSASKVITILRRVLDDVYGSVQKSNFIIARILSVLVMMAILAVIGVAVFIFVFGEHILLLVQNTLGFNIPFIQEFLLFRWIVLIIILFGVFVIVYRYVPNHSLTLKYSVPGAAFATIGWLALTQGFSLYVQYAGGDQLANATFGAFIALMLFLYFSSMIVLLGALINAMLFEWNKHQSVEQYEAERRRIKELEKSDWTGYPDENNTVLLKRKLYKVNRLKEEELTEDSDESGEKSL
jgi:membrane protein